MEMNLADFQAVGTYPNIRIWLKRSVRWVRTLRDRCRNIMAEWQSFPGEDLVLRDWIKRRSSIGLVSLGSSGRGGRRLKKFPTVRLAMRAWLAVPRSKLRWCIRWKWCARSSALAAELKICTPRSTKGGIERLVLVKYLAIFQKGFCWGWSALRKMVHFAFRNRVSWEVRRRERR
jgi:hypothetical protein